MRLPSVGCKLIKIKKKKIMSNVNNNEKKKKVYGKYVNERFRQTSTTTF